MFSIGTYVKLGIGAFILVGGLSVGWYVNKIVDRYNDNIAEIALIEKERNELASSIKRMEEEMKGIKERAKLQDRLAKERELLISQLEVDSKKRETVIEASRNEECVMYPVPRSVADSLLKYAKDKNSDRD